MQKSPSQEQVIWSVLLHGTKEDLETLDRAYEDPELDPRVKKMIHTLRQKYSTFTKRSAADSYPSGAE